MKAEDVIGTLGIDRNLRNLAVGNEKWVILYDMTKVVKIGENTRSIIGSFKWNDAWIRQRLASKYGVRRTNRVRQMLHRVTKIVPEGKANKQAIVFEDIRGIQKLYQRGNGQGRSYRGMMNFGHTRRPRGRSNTRRRGKECK